MGGVAWWIYQRPQPAATRGSRFGQTPPVAAAPVQSGDINVTVNALGTVTSLATVTVRSQISGQIMRIAFTEGQLVNKGDLLVEIDSRPYQLALAQAEGSLKQHQAMLQAAQLDLERYQNLAKTNGLDFTFKDQSTVSNIKTEFARFMEAFDAVCPGKGTPLMLQPPGMRVPSPRLSHEVPSRLY